MGDYEWTTAWYDAVHSFDDDGRTCEGITLMWDLQAHERDWDVQKKCERCEWEMLHTSFWNCACQKLHDEIGHDFYYYWDDIHYCHWCSVVQRCWDCNMFEDAIVTEFCSFHKSRTIGSYWTLDCKCVTERAMTDWSFMQLVKEYVPILRQHGWKIIMLNREEPKVEIYAPYQYVCVLANETVSNFFSRYAIL